MSDIPAELSLDVTQALAAIAQIETALEAAAAGFAESIDASLGALDIPAVDVPVEFDTTGIDELDASLSEASSGVTVPVEADTTAAVEAIDGLEGEEVVVPVTADTSAAQADIEGLTGGIEGAGQAATNFGAEARAGFDVAGAAISGNLAGATGALKGFGPQIAGAAAAIGTLVTVEKVLVGAALESEAATQRFNSTLGTAAEVVSRIDIGGLNIDLRELALSLGSDDEAALNAASSIFQLGVSSGAARGEVAETTKQIEALAARAVALNPSLGSVGDVAERMLTGLARGGRFASQFNIALTATEITAEALRQNVGKTAEELTLYDKAAAGATLATERLGDSLATDIARGGDNVQIQFRRVREAFNETLEATGKPLLEPTLEILEEAQPALEAIATAFSSLLQVVLPLAAGIIGSLVPALEAVTPLLELAGKAAGVLGKAFEIATLPATGGLRLLGAGINFVKDQFNDAGEEVPDASAKIAAAILAVQDVGLGIGEAARSASELSEAWDALTQSTAPLTAEEASLRAEISRLTTALANGTATAAQFRRVFNASGLDTEQFAAAIDGVIAERDRLADSFNSGLPSIGDAFAVEAVKVAKGTKAIDRSFEDLISASDELRDRLTQGLPSIADAFAEGVSPEDLRDAQNTLEAFIQGVEGVSKSAADAAQAVIDKAAVEGGTGLAGFLQKLREQTAEIATFQGTLSALRGRGASDLAATFAERGVESAAVAAEAAALSDADLAAAEATVEAAKGVRAQAVADMGLFADQLVATFGPKGAEAGQVFGEGLTTALGDPAVVEEARRQAEKIANAAAEGASGGGTAEAGPQTLAGFLANLRTQSGDIKAFQDNLNRIADSGAQVLSDTLRQQGIDAATAARQAAGLAPAELIAAEQAVRDAQAVLATAEADNEEAAARLEQFMRDTAARAAAGFTDEFIIDVGPALGLVGAQIIQASNAAAGDAVTGGAILGAAYGGAFGKAAEEALRAGPAGFLLGLGVGTTVQLPPAVLAQATNLNAVGFAGQGTANEVGTGPQVVIENVNVTPPRDASADEQADAVAESLAWRLRGPR